MNAVLVSVIIPTFNRLESLANCLKALENQVDCKEKWEVIIVNDGGIDIASVVESSSKLLNIKPFYQNNYGPAKARNYGVENARGKIVAF